MPVFRDRAYTARASDVCGPVNLSERLLLITTLIVFAPPNRYCSWHRRLVVNRLTTDCLCPEFTNPIPLADIVRSERPGESTTVRYLFGTGFLVRGRSRSRVTPNASKTNVRSSGRATNRLPNVDF